MENQEVIRIPAEGKRFDEADIQPIGESPTLSDGERGAGACVGSVHREPPTGCFHIDHDCGNEKDVNKEELLYQPCLVQGMQEYRNRKRAVVSVVPRAIEGKFSAVLASINILEYLFNS